MALRNRFSAFAKHAPPSTAPRRPVKIAGPAFAHPVPVTVDRDKQTQIERHVFEDGSARFVRPGHHGHGAHKKPTSAQHAQARAAQEAKEVAKQAAKAQARVPEAAKLRQAKPIK